MREDDQRWDLQAKILRDDPNRICGTPEAGRLAFAVLLERSSLGSAEARFLRSLTSHEVVDRIMRLSRAIVGR